MSRGVYKNLVFALKVGIAAVAAILIAEALQLQFALSAGIVAILSVAFTKKETMKTAINRFVAFLVALIIAAGCFYWLGFNSYGFFLYLLLFIIVCQFLSWNSAMAMDSVLISHFISFGEMNLESVRNELLLFAVGVGVGIVANVFLHQNKDYMESMRRETDEMIKNVLHRMSLRILNPQMEDYDGSCFVGLNRSVAKATAIANENYMNRFSKAETEDMKYIAMRGRQTEVLYGMYKHLREIHSVPVSADTLAQFFERVAASYAMDNTVEELFEEYQRLNEEMKKMPLPTDRKEFEDRARLFSVMRGMEEFLLIKKEYMKAQQEKE